MERSNKIQNHLIKKSYPLLISSKIENGYLITEGKYLHNANHILCMDEEILIKTYKKIDELHQIETENLNILPFHFYNEWFEMADGIKNMWIPFNQYLDWIRNFHNRYFKTSNLVICHNDLHPGNILIDQDIQENIYLIDWDFAIYSDLYMDYASVIVENLLACPIGMETFLKYNKKLHLNEYKMNCFIRYQVLYWLAWANLCYEKTLEIKYKEIFQLFQRFFSLFSYDD
ncbi:hypothetical protein ASO20_00815 [Mycoplasma sp. (ex Biomphalaria glabrata)]|nr:hypothetical protein ASO20_00815 [Mycoplasma sp. (ex Biomphalaria glabrata)]